MPEIELRGGAMDGQRIERQPIEIGPHAGEMGFYFPVAVTPEGDRMLSLGDVPDEVRAGFVAAMEKQMPPGQIQGYGFLLASAFYRPQGKTQDGIPVYEFTGTEPEIARDTYLASR